MTVSGLIGATTYAQVISTILFFPLTLFFLKHVIPRRKSALILEPVEIVTSAYRQSTKKKVPTPEPLKLEKSFDIDRRLFIKLIGSAGISLFLFSVFTQKAHGAFFGSVPGPGTVSLKDTSGAQIDPAIKTPTDGYKISQIDDSSPAFYGFIDKTGAWFIMKEDSTGAYRYAKGSSSFSTNWTNRAILSYDYFDAIF